MGRRTRCGHTRSRLALGKHTPASTRGPIRSARVAPGTSLQTHDQVAGRLQLRAEGGNSHGRKARHRQTQGERGGRENPQTATKAHTHPHPHAHTHTPDDVAGYDQRRVKEPKYVVSIERGRAGGGWGGSCNLTRLSATPMPAHPSQGTQMRTCLLQRRAAFPNPVRALPNSDRGQGCRR